MARELDHERLEVYQVARELSREIRLITKDIRPQGNLNILDQVQRAAASILLNIAEGSSERSLGRKAFFYRIARASTTELAAALDYMTDMNMIRASDTIEAKSKIVRVVSMLYKLTSSVQTPDSYPPLRRRK